MQSLNTNEKGQGGAMPSHPGKIISQSQLAEQRQSFVPRRLVDCLFSVFHIEKGGGFVGYVLFNFFGEKFVLCFFSRK